MSRGSIYWGVKMIEQILNDYGIHPLEIKKVTPNVFKITDSSTQFAVKKSSMTPSSLNNWKKALHQAYYSNLTSILPVYLTKNNMLCLTREGHTYYLTPWIDQVESNLNFELFFQSLGQIHKRTIDKVVVPNDIQNEFEKYQYNNKTNLQFLLESVQRFEQNKYMSPFELLVCSQYTRIENIGVVLNSFIKRFLDERKEQSLWKLSLCHGCLKKENIIQSNKLFIINWEKAHYGNATHDLVIFFNNIINEIQIDFDTMIEYFEIYLQENELEMDELDLLVISLLDFRRYCIIVEQYLNRDRTHYSMMNQIMELQRTFRVLMFGLKLSEYVDRRTEELLFEELNEIED